MSDFVLVMEVLRSGSCLGGRRRTRSVTKGVRRDRLGYSGVSWIVRHSEASPLGNVDNASTRNRKCHRDVKKSTLHSCCEWEASNVNGLSRCLEPFGEPERWKCGVATVRDRRRLSISLR